MSNLGKIEPTPIVEEMRRSYLDYAMSVIVSRALPDVRDGLKPVQRRIIFVMFELGLLRSSTFRKCAKIAGDTSGNYHPHGESNVYGALVNLVQDFSMRYPLVDGQGNFGSVDGDMPAAMRYTEARLANISEEMLRDINKETVDFVPNYDGTKFQPSVLPAGIPNLLLNGASGIAVGMATQIPPHNLGELINALTFMIDHPTPEASDGKAMHKSQDGEVILSQSPKSKFESSATIEDLLQFVKGPDFPTGGSIYDQSEIINAYATGKGRIVMRAKAEIEEAKNGRFDIIVTELPYQVNKAVLITRIAELHKDKKIEGISDLRG